MKQARYKEPLPLAVIEAARAGDAGAVEQVLQYYNGYINKLCIIKGIFCRLMEQNFLIMFLAEFLGVTSFPVGHIGLAGLGIVGDMGTQYGNLRHALFRCLDLRRQFVVVGGGCRRFFCQLRIVQQLMFGKKIYSLRHLFQVKNLGPARIPSAFPSL